MVQASQLSNRIADHIPSLRALFFLPCGKVHETPINGGNVVAWVRKCPYSGDGNNMACAHSSGRVFMSVDNKILLTRFAELLQKLSNVDTCSDIASIAALDSQITILDRLRQMVQPDCPKEARGQLFIRLDAQIKALHLYPEINYMLAELMLAARSLIKRPNDSGLSKSFDDLFKLAETAIGTELTAIKNKFLILANGTANT